MVELFEYFAPEGAHPGRIEPRDVGTAHLCFVVDDLPAVYERLRAAGVDTFVSPPVVVDTGINTGGYGLYLRDPDGIVVEIFQPPVTGGRMSDDRYGGLDRQALLDLLRRMIEIRLFEDEVMRLFNRNLVRGSTHLCQGQEAVSVGACSALWTRATR